MLLQKWDFIETIAAIDHCPEGNPQLNKMIHLEQAGNWFYRVCHGFRITKRVDYFWPNWAVQDPINRYSNTILWGAFKIPYYKVCSGLPHIWGCHMAQSGLKSTPSPYSKTVNFNPKPILKICLSPDKFKLQYKWTKPRFWVASSSSYL